MQIIKVGTKLAAEERETILNYDNEAKMWVMDSTVAKHFNKALKQGWKPVVKYIYDDGTTCGLVLTASDRAVTIRNATKKEMSEKQLHNLSSHMREDEE